MGIYSADRTPFHVTSYDDEEGQQSKTDSSFDDNKTIGTDDLRELAKEDYKFKLQHLRSDDNDILDDNYANNQQEGLKNRVFDH